jgi:hypothetical protein
MAQSPQNESLIEDRVQLRASEIMPDRKRGAAEFWEEDL